MRQKEQSLVLIVLISFIYEINFLATQQYYLQFQNAIFGILIIAHYDVFMLSGGAGFEPAGLHVLYNTQESFCYLPLPPLCYIYKTIMRLISRTLFFNNFFSFLREMLMVVLNLVDKSPSFLYVCLFSLINLFISDSLSSILTSSLLYAFIDFIIPKPLCREISCVFHSQTDLSYPLFELTYQQLLCFHA